MGPEAVLRQQLCALQRNDAEAVFNFASPANRQNTGPASKFVTMLETGGYKPLLQHRDHQVINYTHERRGYFTAIVKISGSKELMSKYNEGGEAMAGQVLCSDDEHLFYWSMSQQLTGEFKGCWLTDTVMLLDKLYLRNPDLPSQ